MIYFDNASTSYPKPEAHCRHIAHIYDFPLGSYGRSRDSHTLELSTQVESLRDLLASTIGAKGQGEQICFTKNATEAINTVLKGLPGLQKREILLSPMEHNAVARPVYELDKGADPTLMPAKSDGSVDIAALSELLRSQTTAPRLCVINGMSNINGLKQDIAAIVSAVRTCYPHCAFLLDAAQALPYMHIDVQAWGIDYVAITGHKGLLGPVGTGALYVRDPLSITPLMRGGTGFRSEELADTTHMPERFESGTMNLIGLSAWYVSLKHYPCERELIEGATLSNFIHRLEHELGYRTFAASESSKQGPLFSILPRQGSAATLSDRLYYDFGITTRFGIHCAPLAHRTLGTINTGTVRISLSPYNTTDELSELYEALRICNGGL